VNEQIDESKYPYHNPYKITLPLPFFLNQTITWMDSHPHTTINKQSTYIPDKTKTTKHQLNNNTSTYQHSINITTISINIPQQFGLITLKQIFTDNIGLI
jgi:hypothetical protein